MMKEMTKSLPISKQMVYNSYLKVISKDGAEGIDGESIDMFNANLKGNLYKLWNRMTSGSYFPPPVRTVLIDKKQGGKRPLGIPTVSDRIAQGVVKDYLEPSMEAVFHPSSFGYRPGRSPHHALAQCQDNCIKYAWVIDVDIKGFFDNIDHDKLLWLLRKHTNERWVLMYVKRWLKAGVEQEDGSIVARTKGTPQGGVASPLLSNVYLHHAFDMWMQEYALELHPEKTKIVYCKNYLRNEKHEHESFVFLSYSFQSRTVRDKFGRNKRLLTFSPAICQMAKKHINKEIRTVFKDRMSDVSLEEFARRLRPKIIGWVNYYAKYGKDETYKVFYRLNILIRKWIKNTYKIRGLAKIFDKYRKIQNANPEMFYHWKLGVKA